MPTPYELMDLYRAWWRASYGTEPNPQAVVIAAAFCLHVLFNYQASLDSPTGETAP